jgi:hypothetical protein
MKITEDRRDYELQPRRFPKTGIPQKHRHRHVIILYATPFNGPSYPCNPDNPMANINYF